ncbi:hypothetical protein NLJ89_g6669 [Agrocybe chaxingu]|uniref:Uncharacterized protein n=1 Tax=Agrocybe chaxingu TaxID=84603 RepID=A0A9W8MUF2_9AGAR|nr:hypothetical protein NLJ89_g6669 [Agrocybe chaxingu]
MSAATQIRRSGICGDPNCRNARCDEFPYLDLYVYFGGKSELPLPWRGRLVGGEFTFDDDKHLFHMTISVAPNMEYYDPFHMPHWQMFLGFEPFPGRPGDRLILRPTSYPDSLCFGLSALVQLVHRDAAGSLPVPEKYLVVCHGGPGSEEEMESGDDEMESQDDEESQADEESEDSEMENGDDEESGDNEEEESGDEGEDEETDAHDSDTADE